MGFPVSRRVFSIWRRRLRPWWRDARPIVVATAGLTVIVLGTIGYLDYHRDYVEKPDPDFSVLDAFYRAIGLFGLTGGVDPPLPLTLEIARLLGPIVFGYAALQALLALFRQEARLLGIRLFARDHVVVAGLGEKGFRLATGLHAEGRRVIVLDRDEANPRIAGMRERGITVLAGDATDEEVLGRAQTGRAAYLFALCGGDGTNVDVAVAGERQSLRRKTGALVSFAHLDDEQLWWMLTTAAVGSDQPKFRLEFFNVADRAARALVEKHPPFDGEEHAPFDGEEHAPHVLIVGLHGVGRPLVLRVAGAWRRSAGARAGARLRITLADAGAQSYAAELREAHPEIDAICDLHAVTDASDVDELATATYVCRADETAALATALELRAGAACRGLLVIAVADEESGVARALRAEGRAREDIEAFGVLSNALTPELLEQSETEMLARAKHEEYLRNEQRRGALDPAQNPSHRPWEELEPSLKESNRRFADGISTKLHEARCILVPAPLAAPEDPGFAFTDDEVEALAIKEHDRWVADLLRDGWRPTTGPKDPKRKLHPMLVPWEQLSEDQRDRDRDPVREVPGMLAQAGFRLVRVEEERRAPTLGA